MKKTHFSAPEASLTLQIKREETNKTILLQKMQVNIGWTKTKWSNKVNKIT